MNYEKMPIVVFFFQFKFSLTLFDQLNRFINWERIIQDYAGLNFD